jgi:hypothetical protein
LYKWKPIISTFIIGEIVVRVFVAADIIRKQMGINCSQFVPSVSDGKVAKNSNQKTGDKSKQDNNIKIAPSPQSALQAHNLIRKSNRDLDHHVEDPVMLVASLHDHKDGIYYDPHEYSNAMTGTNYIILPITNIGGPDGSNDAGPVSVAPGKGNQDNGKFICFIETPSS